MLRYTDHVSLLQEGSFDWTAESFNDLALLRDKVERVDVTSAHLMGVGDLHILRLHILQLCAQVQGCFGRYIGLHPDSAVHRPARGIVSRWYRPQARYTHLTFK